MQSDAKTIKEYLQSLSPERKQAMEKVRSVILENLPSGYEEVINWGMITYQVPLSVKADTYNKKPLMYAALASQKNHMAVYLSNMYGDQVNREQFEREYRATGKRYDVGKSCVRFRTLDDLPLELIGKAIAQTGMDQFVADYEGMIAERKKAKGTK